MLNLLVLIFITYSCYGIDIEQESGRYFQSEVDYKIRQILYYELLAVGASSILPFPFDISTTLIRFTGAIIILQDINSASRFDDDFWYITVLLTTGTAIATVFGTLGEYFAGGAEGRVLFILLSTTAFSSWIVTIQKFRSPHFLFLNNFVLLTFFLNVFEFSVQLHVR